MEDKLSAKNLNRTVAGGALVNIAGTVGKALLPVYFVMIARLYGPELLGVFYLAYTIIDVAITLTVSGINDGVMMFASQHHDDSRRGERELYMILANGFVLSLGMAAALLAFMTLGGTALLFSRYQQPGVEEAITLLVWSIPFGVIPVVVVAATKALIMMKWDALLLGFLRPLLLTLLSLGLYFVSASLQSLLWAFLITSVIVALASLAVFAHCFSLRKLGAALLRFRPSKPLAVFSLPQNLNMTFNTFISNMDVIMLGYFGLKPELLGFYGMGAQILRNIRQIKLAFSGAYSPLIARLHKRGDREGLNRSFSTISRWASSFALPTAFLVILFREELLQIFHGSFTFDTTFMLYLLLPPIMSCALGMSGNILVMTGHSGWNLLNSLTVAGINLLLNYLFIPRWGLLGAAAATAIATSIVTAMQLVEVYGLVGVQVLPSKIYKPYLAIFPAAILVAYATSRPEVDLWSKAAFSLLGLALYAALLWLLRLEAEDRALVWPRRPLPAAGASAVDDSHHAK